MLMLRPSTSSTSSSVADRDEEYLPDASPERSTCLSFSSANQRGQKNQVHPRKEQRGKSAQDKKNENEYMPDRGINPGLASSRKSGEAVIPKFSLFLKGQGWIYAEYTSSIYISGTLF